jgi:galactose mutarotase-like enzyme
MGIPLLYPWANRLSHDRLSIGGTEIDLSGEYEALKRDANGLPIHGLMTAAPGWRIERHEGHATGAVLAARFEWAESAERYRLFPFPHTLRLEATFDDGGLELTTTIEADCGVATPVAFGFHPYFTLPGSERAEWRLGLPLTERLELDHRGIPTGERRAVDPEDGPLGERSFDDLYRAPAAGVPLALSGGGRRIELLLDPGFPYAQIYAPAGERLIALEPMTAPTDALCSAATNEPRLTSEPFAATFRIEVSATRG